jgi:hypothetical protein
LLKLDWVLMVVSLIAAELQNSLKQAPARKNEIKLFVFPAHTEQALAVLKLNES